MDGAGAPGLVLDDNLTVACGDGALRLLRLQRGVYVINPDLKIRQGESWVGIYQLLRLGDLAAPRFEEVVAPAVADRYRQLGQGADLLKPHPRYQAGIDAFRRQLRQRLESVAGERSGAGAPR